MSSSSFNRPGAVDLSQLAQQAKQSATQANGPRAASGSYVVEVTEQTFEAETIRKSVKHPVVVELYSPRVATGRQLSDALIEIANASEGKFLLARLNVDTAPGIVQALPGCRPCRRSSHLSTVNSPRCSKACWPKIRSTRQLINC